MPLIMELVTLLCKQCNYTFNSVWSITFFTRTPVGTKIFLIWRLLHNTQLLPDACVAISSFHTLLQSQYIWELLWCTDSNGTVWLSLLFQSSSLEAFFRVTVAQSNDFQFLFSHTGRSDIYWSSTGNVFIKLATILSTWQYSLNHCQKQLTRHFPNLCSWGHTCAVWNGPHRHCKSCLPACFPRHRRPQKVPNLTFRNASFCSRCLLIMGVTWSVSELGPSLSAPPHQSSSRLYSCSRLSSTLHTFQEKGDQFSKAKTQNSGLKKRKPIYPLHIPPSFWHVLTGT